MTASPYSLARDITAYKEQYQNSTLSSSGTTLFVQGISNLNVGITETELYTYYYLLLRYKDKNKL